MFVHNFARRGGDERVGGRLPVRYVTVGFGFGAAAAAPRPTGAGIACRDSLLRESFDCIKKMWPH